MGTPRLDRLENAIINAPLEFWQRVAGTTTTINTATPQALWTADRVHTSTLGATVKNFSVVRSTDVPAQSQVAFQLPYSLQFNSLTAITSPAAGDIVVPWQYKMEGYDYARFHGNAATFAFWIKVSSTASFPITVPVAFENGSRSYITTVSVAANNTWQQCFVNLTMDNAGGWAFDSSLGLRISIGSGAVGSTFTTNTLNTWQNGLFFAPTSAFNIMGVNTNVIRIAAPQMVLGTFTATSGLAFGRAGRSVMNELQLCQRYYEKTYETDVVPGSITGAGQTEWRLTNSAGSQAIRLWFSYKVSKRASGTTICWSPSTSNNPNKVDVATTPIAGSMSVLSSSQYACGFEGVASAGQMSNCHINGHMTCDSEL